MARNCCKMNYCYYSFRWIGLYLWTNVDFENLEHLEKENVTFLRFLQPLALSWHFFKPHPIFYHMEELLTCFAFLAICALCNSCQLTDLWFDIARAGRALDSAQRLLINSNIFQPLRASPHAGNCSYCNCHFLCCQDNYSASYLKGNTVKRPDWLHVK